MKNAAVFFIAGLLSTVFAAGESEALLRAYTDTPHYDFVQTCLKGKPSTTDKQGRTLLLYCLQEVPEVYFAKQVHWLLMTGQNPNAVIPATGQTALHLAAERNDYRLALRLLAFGADYRVRDKKGRTPAALALMPQLRALNPQATTAITRFIEQARQVDTFIEKLAEKAVMEAKAYDSDAYSRDALLSLEEPIRSLALCRIVKTAEECHIRLLNAALEKGDGAVVLPSGTRWCVTPTALVAQDDKVEMHPCFCYSAKIGKTYTIGNDTYRLKTLSREEYEQKLNICKYLFANALDYDKINGDLVLRQRKAGDSFHPVGRNCGKSLKKLFNEQKTVSRNTVPILCDDSGIALVCGFGCDERVAITEATKTVLLVIKEEEVYENATSGC